MKIKRADARPLHPFPQLQPISVCPLRPFSSFSFASSRQRERAQGLCIRSLYCEEKNENNESGRNDSASVPSTAPYILCVRSLYFHLFPLINESGRMASASALLIARETVNLTRADAKPLHPFP